MGPRQRTRRYALQVVPFVLVTGSTRASHIRARTWRKWNIVVCPASIGCSERGLKIFQRGLRIYAVSSVVRGFSEDNHLSLHGGPHNKSQNPNFMGDCGCHAILWTREKFGTFVFPGEPSAHWFPGGTTPLAKTTCRLLQIVGVR